MAKRAGMTQSAVSRIWRAFALQPHRTETFKLSKDPLFIEKVRDVVGLYMDPPDRALVLSVDEKSELGEDESRRVRTENSQALEATSAVQIFQVPSTAEHGELPRVRAGDEIEVDHF
jgi:hypothetical protein